jgi:enamine deaminase RidA (YjgF/YER057c/UK114 family)
MPTKAINPWKWQDHYGFSQAIEVAGAQRTVFLSGQTSVDGDGNPLHAGDMARQIGQALDNVETVLRNAGLTMANVVRLNYYTCDLARFMDGGVQAATERLAKSGCKPSSTLLVVAGLFHPDILIELEATAVA